MFCSIFSTQPIYVCTFWNHPIESGIGQFPGDCIVVVVLKPFSWLHWWSILHCIYFQRGNDMIFCFGSIATTTILISYWLHLYHHIMSKMYCHFPYLGLQISCQVNFLESFLTKTLLVKLGRSGGSQNKCGDIIRINTLRSSLHVLIVHESVPL